MAGKQTQSLQWVFDNWDSLSETQHAQILSNLDEANRDMLVTALNERESDNKESDAKEQARNASITSLGTALIGTGGTVGGLVLADHLMNPAVTAPAVTTTGTGATATGTAATTAGAGTATAAETAGGAGLAASGGGTFTVAAGEAVPAGYTAVGTAANGGTIVVADSAAGAATTGAAEAGSLSSLGPYAAIIASAIGQGRGIHEGLQDYNRGHGSQQQGLMQIANSAYTPLSGFNEILGKPIGSSDLNRALLYFNPALGPIGPAVAISDATGMNFWSGKDADQLQREAITGAWKDSGFANQDNTLKLADGTIVDLGKDGGFTLDNGLHPYQVDLARQQNDPVFGQMVGAVDPLAFVLSGRGSHKANVDTTGRLVNALASSPQENWQSNLRDLYDRAAGGDPTKSRDVIYGGILDSMKQGRLDQNTGEAYLAAIDRVYGVKNEGDKRPDWNAFYSGRTEDEISAAKDTEEEAAKRRETDQQYTQDWIANRRASQKPQVVTPAAAKNPSLKNKGLLKLGAR